jgi:hypothetical protein
VRILDLEALEEGSLSWEPGFLELLSLKFILFYKSLRVSRALTCDLLLRILHIYIYVYLCVNKDIIFAAKIKEEEKLYNNVI